jgi:hypothetical protein
VWNNVFRASLPHFFLFFGQTRIAEADKSAGDAGVKKSKSMLLDLKIVIFRHFFLQNCWF